MLISSSRTKYSFGPEEMSEELYDQFWKINIDGKDGFDTSEFYLLVAILERLSLI